MVLQEDVGGKEERGSVRFVVYYDRPVLCGLRLVGDRELHQRSLQKGWGPPQAT